MAGDRLAQNALAPSHDVAHSRFHGAHQSARHAGVFHAHRSSGHAGHARTGTHHRSTGHPAKHHRATARASHALSERGTVIGYQAGPNTATVQLLGTLNRAVAGIPVSLAVPTTGIVNKNCLVALLDAHNPADAVLIATW